LISKANSKDVESGVAIIEGGSVIGL